MDAKWWHVASNVEESKQSDSQRIICDLCPRHCAMKEGDRGFCFVRKVEHGRMVLDTYGKSTGFCIDPIEKKPLNHFYPGTSVLSFGTAGCNLGCQFCQNWDISKSREVARLSEHATPETIANAAIQLNCKSVAFTYNDPVVWAEYAIDTAKVCSQNGIRTVAVTAGYMSPAPRKEFYQHIDAANVDLKAFSEDFYRKITYSQLNPVLDTLRYLRHETDVWFEITNLVIPDLNDSTDELRRMCDWIVEELGSSIPVHFSAFHPDFRMRDRPNTPHETLIQAYNIAASAGIEYPYVGNVHDSKRSSTFCPNCKLRLVERDWYQLGEYQLIGDRCGKCGLKQSGRFDMQPGNWGRKRLPVNLESFRIPSSQPAIHQLSFPERRSDETNGTAVLNQHPQSAATPAPVQVIPTEDPMSMSAPKKLEMLKLDELTEEQKKSIHKAAQIAVVSAVTGRPLTSEWFGLLANIADLHVFGLFTTLTRSKQLRGCCGFEGRPTTLAEALFNSAQKTAKEDVRMTPISVVELPYLSLDISILTAPVVVEGPAENRAEKIRVGTHGIRISTGKNAGLLLPSVPVEQGWDERQFLEGVCRKAGILESAWKSSDTVLEAFQGLIIEGKIDNDSLPSEMVVKQPPGDLLSLRKLKEVATNNIIALTQGRTPSYVALDAMDGTVNGIVLTLRNAENNQQLANWIQTSLRPGIPLQSSLLELCKVAADVLSRARFEKHLNIQVEVTVLFDPVHHGHLTHDDWDGTVLTTNHSNCDLQGIEPSQRAIVSLCGDRAAVSFDAKKSASQLLEIAASAVRIRRNPVGVFSMGCISTLVELNASNSVVAFSSEEPRPPAVANTFYPADRAARLSIMERFEQQLAPTQKKSALGLMTPHAGLRFSGLTALDVWRRVVIPSDILILGPKHTGIGCDWAVSPSRIWDIPGGRPFPNNLEFAKLLAREVEGLSLDLGAHAKEHGIEIQLPILEYLLGENSLPRITAIVYRGASWDEIDLFATQLANVLERVAELPLLVISSDLNHYQPEEENRRRDELALAAMLTGDAKHVLETCRKNAISMCGVVPAAIVFQTLNVLGIRFTVEQTSYTNSAQFGGDQNKVVGYGGMLILPA